MLQAEGEIGIQDIWNEANIQAAYGGPKSLRSLADDLTWLPLPWNHDAGREVGVSDFYGRTPQKKYLFIIDIQVIPEIPENYFLWPVVPMRYKTTSGAEGYVKAIDPLVPSLSQWSQYDTLNYPAGIIGSNPSFHVPSLSNVVGQPPVGFIRSEEGTVYDIRRKNMTVYYNFSTSDLDWVRFDNGSTGGQANAVIFMPFEGSQSSPITPSVTTNPIITSQFITIDSDGFSIDLTERSWGERIEPPPSSDVLSRGGVVGYQTGVSTHQVSGSGTYMTVIGRIRIDLQ